MGNGFHLAARYRFPVDIPMRKKMQTSVGPGVHERPRLESGQVAGPTGVRELEIAQSVDEEGFRLLETQRPDILGRLMTEAAD